MTLAQIVKLVLMLSVVLTVLALALRARRHEYLHLFREWRLGLRALVAMFVLVPAAAILVIGLFDLKPPVEIALAALAFSPVPHGAYNVRPTLACERLEHGQPA